MGEVFGSLLGGVAAARCVMRTPSMVVAVDLSSLAFSDFRRGGTFGRKQVSFDFFEATGETFFHGWA